MSDFLFSSIQKPQGELTRHIQSIYHSDAPEVKEFHGPWGSLGVSRNLYHGFQPLETEQHIFIVIGGPVLYFRDNRFLMESDPVAGTKAVYERWLNGQIIWDEDLSGPFAVFVVDKFANHITYVTDMMLFIPIYCYREDNKLFLGTHIDTLAKTAGRTDNVDTASLVDFVLNGAVTYPYTVYKDIYLALPASITIETADRVLTTETYWVPEETNPYKNINEAATALREGLKKHVDRITENMKEVAQFLSGGEDSRTLLGLIPSDLKRDAFIFLDSMNREGRTAQKAARAYGANFHVEFRSPTHYLEILEEASDLVGSGHEYIHAHSLRFHSGLTDYPAVFGGYSADTFLKGHYAKKLRGLSRFPFLPEVFIRGETRTKPMTCPLFEKSILAEIDERRLKHMERVRKIRPVTSHEWFAMWPSTMRIAIPNLYSNRRLFRSYEVFLCNDVVKIGAAVPTAWKLNRRLFNRAMRPYLEPSKWLLHGQGWLPYFPWWFNVPVCFSVWSWHQFTQRTGIAKETGNQGPWFDWDNIINSDKWNELVKKYRKNISYLGLAKISDPLERFFSDKILTKIQKLDLLQTLYKLDSVRK